MISSTAIPYPIAYIKVVEVKNLAVGLLLGAIGTTLCVSTHMVSRHTWVEPVWY